MKRSIAAEPSELLSSSELFERRMDKGKSQPYTAL